MKIIIADDEKLVRVSLRSMLTELNLPLEVIDEATNGQEMVDLVSKYTPDVVFVDIRMPKLSGLAAIKAAKKVSPNTQWIILTGFSEFEYAQEAIRLSAINYLLKPVSMEQLGEALQKVLEQNKKNMISTNKEFENDVTALFHGLSSLPNEVENSIFIESHFKAALFLIDSPLMEKLKAERQLQFCRMVRQLINELLDSEVRLALFSMPNGDLAILSAWGFNPGIKGKEASTLFFERLEELVAKYNDEKMVITIFQSDEHTSFIELVAQLHQFEALAPVRVLLGIGQRLLGKELNEYSNDKALMEFTSILIELYHSHKEINYAAYTKSLRSLTKMTASIEPYFSKIKEPLSSYICDIIGCQIPLERDIKYWLKTLEEYGEKLLETQSEKKYLDSDMIEGVIAYINQNYMYDIGISQIAEKIAVTPNYLSALFHKRTGKGFMKYLTEVRMIKAKELLANPNLQIQQVAEEVGYYSARHFTKLFTQFVGCYPSEYRKKFASAK